MILFLAVTMAPISGPELPLASPLNGSDREKWVPDTLRALFFDAIQGATKLPLLLRAVTLDAKIIPPYMCAQGAKPVGDLQGGIFGKAAFLLIFSLYIPYAFSWEL